MNFKLICCSVAVGLTVVSCFDDNYDLDNIDTTSKVEVKDLVVPINLGVVKLSDIIDLDENGSDIQIVQIDNESYYAVSRGGDFKSENIFIKAPEATAPNLESKYAPLYSDNGVFALPEEGNDFTFACNDVDKSIVSIKSAKVKDLDFIITFTTPALATGTYTTVDLQLPKGMTGSATNGSYNASNGVWTLKNLAINKGVAEAVYTATAIDLSVNDFVFENHKFDFTSNFSILGGQLEGSGDRVELQIDFKLTKLDVTAVTGEIMYEIEGMTIDDISLADIPDFLNGDQTNIAITNPLICLQTTNPVGADNLEYSAALALTAKRDNVSSKPFESNEFTVGYNDGVGPYNTILSPVKPSFVPSPFDTKPNFVGFPELGEILAGQGIPNSISVTVKSPRIPNQPVNDFELGRDLPGVVGSYELFAPLSLVSGSTIVYTDTKDGWNEDVEDLFIKKLKLTAVGTNDTPLNASVKIVPLGVDGNDIKNVNITPASLAAKDTKEIEFLIEAVDGYITGLDGIRIEATVVSKDNQTLSPDQTLSFKDIRITVDGYYQKEL